MGYMQGMCDLVAPLLVILDDETLSYSCFCLLMERMSSNFPHSGGAMDTHFANMRYYLILIYYLAIIILKYFNNFNLNFILDL